MFNDFLAVSYAKEVKPKLTFSFFSLSNSITACDGVSSRAPHGVLFYSGISDMDSAVVLTISRNLHILGMYLK